MTSTPQHLTILTGGSRGMGQAMARQLLADGHFLVSIARHASAELQSSSGSLQQWTLDLSDGAAAAARLREWLAQQGAGRFASATLINNAGVIPAIAPLSASDPAELARALRVGLEAPMQLTAAFLAATEEWGVPRKVLNISSGLGRRPMASQSAYCAAKAGMDHFTRCLALDEAAKPHGARVCSLAPGVIDTDMQVQLRSADAAQFPDVGNFAQLKAGGLLTSPDDAAKRVLAWLARPDFGAAPVADVRDA
ncbi:NAD(P)-dependent dehydrogenase, short-chain alcohol dehydrogenase family [Oryzisolibacter propanilivorax]|uniref:NAD(P)-dependent dehydrogenase, short-chain alcohol dehydrogenase family n=1 Tax=Oryzisolibacter propanilivorax TaxID=1527607 RepID=A0A1G9P7L2_9BURK|nr:SDR family NAD(P)-dependent oxidoreductase [Oryzisolibacter propanilivorax]SDL94543.1 NAD(P)-dependent dehydrogenase, short-chain alcohol dehydrogenase family [Oryzisolibacter propanilivorax]